jgi:hypothetical protein
MYFLVELNFHIFTVTFSDTRAHDKIYPGQKTLFKLILWTMLSWSHTGGYKEMSSILADQ